MQSFGSNVCSYQFLSHRLFRSQDVGAWCFLFSPKGFSTGVEMTECELDKFLYRHSLSLRSIKDRFLLLWSNDMAVKEMKTRASCCYLALLAVSLYDHL